MTPPAGNTHAVPGRAGRFLAAAGLALCAFVLGEVNHPVLQPESRLALFAMGGTLIVLLSVPPHPRLGGRTWAMALDGVLAVLTVAVFAYVVAQSEPVFRAAWSGGASLGDRAGQETALDIAVGGVGVLLVLESTRRAVGPSLPLLTVAFLAYARWGASLPDWLLPHRGYPWSRVVSQVFLHSQGVFGVALKVMFSYVFPFVIFGAVLEATGATQFIMDVARRVFRGSAGGPAKVAVLSSGLMGSLSGSAVANVATTGTFTIPMMRSSGFSAELAGAIEAAASTGGALVPPVMGAGAYMMLELIDPPLTYLTIIKAALIPAVLYYAALLLLTHFYASRIGARRTGAEAVPLKRAQGAVFVAAFGTLIALLAAGFSPFRAVTVAIGAILVVAAPSAVTRVGWRQGLRAMVRAARGGAPLIVAAACAGVVLGVVTLTGVGSRVPALILPLAENNLYAALGVLMLCTLVLGMGLPSAVCYLLMATLAGPVLGHLGVPPLAAHMFIFYFGLMSMVTPPVALAAYTAAAIAGGDVMKTSWAALRLALVGFAMPFAFVTNPALLLMPRMGTPLAIVAGLASVSAGTVFLAAALAGQARRRLRLPARAVLMTAAMLLMLTRTVPEHVALRLAAAVAGAATLAWRGDGARARDGATAKEATA